jgi:hypothetical protein
MESIIDIFLADALFNPFEIYDIDQSVFVKYIHSELLDSISKGGYVLVAKNNNQVVGLISLEQSEWDSEHFKTPISKINHLLALGTYFEQTNVKRRLISSLLAKCSRNLLLHVSARVNKEDLSSIHSLESRSFKLMDVLVTYSIDLRKTKPIGMDNRYSIRKFRPEEVSKLAEIAFESFEKTLTTDRFHADPTLSKEKSSDLYSKWLENSCNDPYSEVIVAEIEGKTVGFNVCSINASLIYSIGLRIGTMSLTAVDSFYRKKRIAVSLLSASLNWFSGKVDVVDTGGQVSNYAIQRAWNTLGLKITRSQCTFHWSVLTEDL